MSTKLRKILLATGVVSMGLTSVAFADTVATNASMTIRAAVALTNNTSLSFGTIDLPTDATTTYTLTNAGGTSTSGGNGAFVASSAAGDISVAGENGQTVDLSITAGACTGSGITLSSMEATYNSQAFNNGAAASTTVNNSSPTMNVGGAIALTTSASTGAQTCAYTVTVAYQ